ncbi:F-box protein [Actinidia chinensis var. chinensis]|uniref:F-box protein n=1 Tax=Actinidia chinensis var. chinensis TaxID=1590841 RepID=A0A2R6S1H1_ACTCC|nr:F-box protein [Actinidia chinensis var. chinensis]
MGYVQTKMAKQISRKRRILAIGCMLSEHLLEAEEVVNNVDLLTEILLCLPAKSLLRLKSRSHRSRYHFGAYLAFDLSKSPHYKVLLVSYDDNYLVSPGTFYDTDIYPLEIASWKHMRLTTPPGVSYLRRVFWNGAIHWMSQENIHIRFDVDAENLMGTALPSIPRILSKEQIRYFGQCGGDLLLIQTRMCHAMKFRILTMDKDCSRWNVKYWVNLKPVISGILGITSRFFSVLSVVNGANGKDLVLVLAVTGNFVLYNVDCKTLKALPELQSDESHEPGLYRYFNVYRFIESLSPF